jgi:hypothetical protein
MPITLKEPAGWQSSSTIELQPFEGQDDTVSAGSHFE